MKNYRTFYEMYYQITIPKDYEVHHIDFNRNNNDIKNLILLPKQLHQRIHHCHLTHCISLEGDLSLFEGCGNQLICGMMSDVLKEMADIYKELQVWASKKELETMKAKGMEGPMFYSYNEFR